MAVSSPYYGHIVFLFSPILCHWQNWQRFDRRLEENAAVLGHNRWRRLFTVISAGRGANRDLICDWFAVSAALYLPTIFAGHGRFITLTTEAVILASGAGRQALGAAAFMQMPASDYFCRDRKSVAFRYRHFSAFKF